jgi:U6 snRNA-associated Sm-like protein LSm4
MASASGPIFPSTVLRNSVNATVIVELRSGESLQGTLLSADEWMNLVLGGGVIRTSAGGDQFWKVPQVVVRGNSVRSVNVPPASVRPAPPRPASQPGQPQRRPRA